MRIQQCFFGGWMAMCLVATSACGYSPTAHTPTTTGTGELFEVIGVVQDDSCLGPDAVIGEPCKPVAGVRVEVLDGPDKGKVAMTDALGAFDLGVITQLPASCLFVYCTSAVTPLGASKDGWAANVHTVNKGSASSVNETIRLGQAPHTLSGSVSLPGSSNAFVGAPGVRVEIIGGPDAGKTALTNDRGFYRLDGLATQDAVRVEFSKDGFVTTRRQSLFNLVTNQSVPTFQLPANPGPQ